jgi:hypothetical protein
LADGLQQLADVTAGGVNVYYDAALNPLLDDETYSLGDGELLPVNGNGGAIATSLATAVPEPTALGIIAVVGGGLLGRRRRRVR